MQVKVVIGTIAFMLTMIILGFAALLEPARMAERTADYTGRNIETGADLYQNNCATCHGPTGDAQNCVSASGGSIACVGRPLNHPDLLCGEPSQRMTDLNWQGTKRNLIFTTISAGRPGTLMPTWSETFGGPLYEAQVHHVTDFVMNWEESACAVGAATPLPGAEWPATVEELPVGDPANGEVLFANPYPCAGCHGDPNTPGSNPVGPDLSNIGSDGETRIEGMSAMQYIYESILEPNAHIAPICANGAACTSPSGMPDIFDTMPQQDMADIIAFLMQHGGE